MKIERVETFQISCPIEPNFGWSQGWVDHRVAGLVKITTDDGSVGWGEGCVGSAAAVVEQDLAPLLRGGDPMDRLGLWEAMFAANYNGNTIVGLVGNAISAVDIALWDLAGKIAGRPVFDLLGGRLRDRVAVYATGLYYTEGELPDRLPAEARGYAEAGFLGMKTKVGGLSIEADVARVGAIRDAIGPDVHLAVDANQGYDAASAQRIAARLGEHNVIWFEEPVNALDVEGYMQVKATAPMAIAGGECLRTRFEWRPFFKSRALDIAQPDVSMCGGITEMARIIAAANSTGVQVYPHVWGTPVMISASLHVASTIPNTPTVHNPLPFCQEPVMEFDRTPSAMREEICTTAFDQEDGFLSVPTGPGLGVEVDERALQHFAV
ncbi:MAG: mandelate racemase/muconate lactonizing enzyme family protein [Candidatus Latescibacterota bacterium]|nr:mandelate racemase/muconate lactonizing enzyme family protein [Candidatus Latescibacterota bacterium]